MVSPAFKPLQNSNVYVTSALMTLYTSYLGNNGEGGLNGLQHRAVVVLDNAADIAYQVARKYLEKESFDYQYGDIPPFVLPWMYMAAVRLINQSRGRDTSELNEKLVTIEKALKELSDKWKSSGELHHEFCSHRH
jgi:hypothetical protein